MKSIVVFLIEDVDYPEEIQEVYTTITDVVSCLNDIDQPQVHTIESVMKGLESNNNRYQTPSNHFGVYVWPLNYEEFK